MFHLLPMKQSTWCFPIQSLLRKLRTNFHSTNYVQFPRESRLKQDCAQDHRISYWQNLNTFPGL